MEKNESSTSQGFKFGCGLGLGLVAAAIIVVFVLPILGLSMCGMCANTVTRLEKAKPEKAAIDIKQIGLALDMYNADNGMYPTTEQGLNALFKKPTLPPVPENWTEPYVEETKFLDPWGARYIYESPSKYEGFDFDLYSYGDDGVEGGGDDINSWLR